MTHADTTPDRTRRSQLLRRVRHGARELSLQTQAYVVHVARRAGLPRADVHATGVVKAAHDSDRPLSPGDLGRTLGLTPAAVTALLDRMARNGHVTRTRSRADARRQELAPTAEALATTHALFDDLVDAYDERLAAYSDAELEVAARILEDLTAGTRSAMTRPRPQG